MTSKVGVIEGSMIMEKMGDRDAEYLSISFMRRCSRESIEQLMASHHAKYGSLSSFLFLYDED